MVSLIQAFIIEAKGKGELLGVCAAARKHALPPADAAR